MKTFESLADLPNKRGEYQVNNVEFANDTETVKVTIDYDVDEETCEVVKSRYSYVVTSLDDCALYDGCWGFATIRDMVPNIAPRLKAIN